MEDSMNKLIRQVESGNFESLDNRASKDVSLSERGEGGKAPEAANFTLQVRRKTFVVIAGALPFAMFGASVAINGYRRLITQLIPVGVTLVIVQRGEYNVSPENVNFVYTTGAGGFEIVSITCPQTPYPQLLDSTITDNFKASKIRYSLTEVGGSAVSQYSQAVTVWRTTMFGRASFDTLDLTTYRKPNDFQSGIVDVEGSINIDKEMCITHQVINNPTPFTDFGFNWSMFVEKYYRQTAQGL